MRKYFLVNSITAASLILGLIAIFYVMHGYLYLSFAFALLAFISDATDGYLARKLGAESRFGAIFDTVADVIVYLLYPVMAMYYQLEVNSCVGIFLIFTFFIVGIFRLIRFTMNGFLETGEKKYYLGMPVFFSHFMIMIMLLIGTIDKSWLQIAGPLLLGIISVMMVTKLKFRKPTSVYLAVFLCLILIVSISMFLIPE